MSWSCILAQGMRLGLVRMCKAGRSARIEPKPRAHLVWSGLALKDAWAPHLIPNCKKTELRLGYRTCQLIGICIVTVGLGLWRCTFLTSFLPGTVVGRA